MGRCYQLEVKEVFVLGLLTRELKLARVRYGRNPRHFPSRFLDEHEQDSR